MRQMVGLIRAELIQHRAGMVITPLVIAGLIAVFVIAQLVLGTSGIDISIGDFGVTLDNERIVDPAAFEEAGRTAAAAFGFVGLPVFLVANIVAFFVMLSALYEERTERTVLFFKSMPVSDWKAIAAKYITASFLGPMIAIAVMMGLSILLSLATATVFSLRGIADIWGFLTELPLIRLFLSLAGYWVLYALLAAPIFAFLLMVSALAQRAPFLFATLPIAVAAIAEAVLLGSSALINGIGGRLFGTKLIDMLRASRGAGEMGPDAAFDGAFIRFSDGFLVMSSSDFWIGLGLAAAFLAVAVWARSRNTL